jgi:FK506-binding protein 1
LAKAAQDKAKQHALKEETVLMCRADFAWDPQDRVEVDFMAGEVLCVTRQQSESDGWWEGQKADGTRGLFPFNHVSLLSKEEAHLFQMGKALPPPAQHEAAPADRLRKDHIPKTAERPVKAVPNFVVTTTQAFDDMIDKGFALENVSGNANGGHPKMGDLVECSFKAYVWDSQLLSILEFLASEDKGEGPLHFVVGDEPSICKGLHLAVQKLCVGESGRVIIAPKMGYGVAGSPPVIPPHAHLVYDVTLLRIMDNTPTEKVKPEVKLRSASTLTAPRILSMKGLKPVLNRPNNAGDKKVMTEVNTASSTKVVEEKRRVAGHVMVGAAPAPGQAQAPKKPEVPKYELKDLQEMFSSGKAQANGLNPNGLEDYLTEKAFFEAFLMDRGHFLLKPQWRQQALKRAVGLF